MTSVGYGQYYPKTDLGKLFTVLAAHLGQLLLAIGVMTLTNAYKLTSLERAAYDQVNLDVARKKKIGLAVRWIQTCYRYRLYMKYNDNP